MNKIAVTAVSLWGACSLSWAGHGTGRVVDVTLRAHDNVLLAKVETHSARPACVVWHHTFAKKYDGSAPAKALYAMLLSAQLSGYTVLITGTGTCLLGTGAEEIHEMNIGPWGN